MKKEVATLLGAVATLGALNGAQASPAPEPSPADALKVNSYAELLEPVPNAAKILQAIDEQVPAQSTEGSVKVAQWYHHHHHHHHHHHGWGYGYYGYGPRVYVVPHRRYHHHHHHHHHHWYYDRY